MVQLLQLLRTKFYFFNYIVNLMAWNSLWKAFLDLMLITFFTMLATLLTIISMLHKSNNVDWVSLYNNGNFFLYAISLFSSSLIFYVNRNDRNFGKYSVMILIILCALIYSQFINDQKSNTDFTKYGSIICICLSFFSFLITQYYQRLEMPDVNAQDQDNQQQVANEIQF